MKDKELDWALFWCPLLDPVMHGEIDREDEEAVRSFLKAIAPLPRGKNPHVKRLPSVSSL